MLKIQSSSLVNCIEQKFKLLFLLLFFTGFKLTIPGFFGHSIDIFLAKFGHKLVGIHVGEHFSFSGIVHPLDRDGISRF